MKEKEFKIKLNPAILYFEIFYMVYVVYLFIIGQMVPAIVCAICGLLIIAYFSLWRPYKYTINRRTLIINRRVGKDKEINIMTCETILWSCTKRWQKLITSPRALEIYAENKKRFVVTPKDRMGFIEAVVAANKRIHVQCTEYAATHRSYEKKRKRALKERS